MNLDPQWIVGFVDGEGCFFVGINRQPAMKVGFQVLPEFVVVQHVRDVQLLHALKARFGCGSVIRNHGDRWAYRARGQTNLMNKILPFFEKHKLKSRKRQEFESFRRVVLMIEEKKHLTINGLEEVRTVVGRMNNARTWDLQPNNPKIESSPG